MDMANRVLCVDIKTRECKLKYHFRYAVVMYTLLWKQVMWWLCLVIAVVVAGIVLANVCD